MLTTTREEHVIDVDADNAIRLILQCATLESLCGASLRGKTLGVVGDNALGRAVCERAELAFGMNVLRCNACDRKGMLLSVVMSEADVIFVALPDTPANTNVISALRFNQMKPDAVLVALSALRTIDMCALRHALWFETIGGATFDPNGLTSDDLVQLSMCDNVVLDTIEETRNAGKAPLSITKSIGNEKVSMRAA